MTNVSNDNQTEKRAELTARLKRGIEEVKDSRHFKEYLTFASRFHQYSLNNRLLIWLQRPNASHVAGFQTWKSLGRHVMKGEKAIAILAPIAFRRCESSEGAAEGEEERVAVAFRVVHVFDVSQTDGEPLPQLTTTLEGAADDLVAGLLKVAGSEGLTVSDDPEAAREGIGGYYEPAKGRIWLNPDIKSTAQRAQTLAHELAHHFAREDRCSRAEGEIVADSAAYLVLGHNGLDAGDFSFDYVAIWASRAEPGAFEKKLAAAHAAADMIIARMEARAAQE